jgi:TPR repeat protein
MAARFAAIRRAIATAAIGFAGCSHPPAQADLDVGVAAWERGDYPAAYREWKSLADQGDSDAQYFLGSWYYHAEKDYTNAAKWLREAPQQGHPLAQHDLGSLYVLGQGVPPNDTQAAEWFRRAAEQGHPLAQYNLGASYYSGEGVPQDFAQAAALFQKAATADIAPAEQNLGVMYAQGLGVEQNYQEAAKWFRRAAEQSAEEALSKTGAFKAGQLGREFPIVAGQSSPTMETYREGMTYILANARAALGEFYAFGLGVPRDYVEAQKWLDLAVNSLPPGDERDAFTQERDSLAAQMTQSQVAEAKRLARDWSEIHRVGDEQ